MLCTIVLCRDFLLWTLCSVADRRYKHSVLRHLKQIVAGLSLKQAVQDGSPGGGGNPVICESAGKLGWQALKGKKREKDPTTGHCNCNNNSHCTRYFYRQAADQRRAIAARARADTLSAKASPKPSIFSGAGHRGKRTTVGGHCATQHRGPPPPPPPSPPRAQEEHATG